MDYILEADNLSKQYGKNGFLLDHISLRVPYGSIVGLIGENGAGKTTAISCLLNTVSRDSGTVRFFGQEMSDRDRAVREDLAVVLDSAHFSGHLSAAQLSKVMQGIYTKWEPHTYADYLNRLQIPSQKRISDLSKGTAMKLSIAAALSHRPKLLILDEATGGLDPVVRDEILDLFLDFVQDEEHSILFSSHITGDLEKIADYITFLHGGSVILSEEKDRVLYNYGILRCTRTQFFLIDRADMAAYRNRDHSVDVLVTNKKETQRKYADCVIDPVTIEEMMLILIRGERV